MSVMGISVRNERIITEGLVAHYLHARPVKQIRLFIETRARCRASELTFMSEFLSNTKLMQRNGNRKSKSSSSCFTEFCRLLPGAVVS